MGGVSSRSASKQIGHSLSAVGGRIVAVGARGWIGAAAAGRAAARATLALPPAPARSRTPRADAPAAARAAEPSPSQVRAAAAVMVLALTPARITSAEIPSARTQINVVCLQI